jgi:hypothetical protein
MVTAVLANLSENRKIFMIALVAFLFFFLAQGLRFATGNPNLIGYPTYRLARVAQIVLSGSFYDPLSYQGTQVVYFPTYFVTLGSFSFITLYNTYYAAFIFGPSLGALSSVFVYLIVRQYKTLNPTVSSILIFLTPISIYLFSHAGSRALPFMLGLLSLYLFRKGKRKTFVLTMLATSLAHTEPAAFFFIYIILISVFGRGIKRDWKFLLTVALLCVLPYITQFLVFGISGTNILHEQYAFPDRASLHPSSFYDLVSIVPNDPYSALSLPVILLCAYALLKRREKYTVSILLLSVIAALFFQRLRLYLIFPITLLVSSVPRNRITHTLLLLMIPFAVSTSLWMSTIGPSNCLISLMPDTGDSSETIIANWAFGHQIEFLANKKVFMDASAEYVPDIEQRYEDFVTIYTGDNVAESLGLIESNNIDYLLLLDSDQDYFASRGLDVNIENLGLTVLKHAECGILYATD